MLRAGRIEFDTDDANLNALRINLPTKAMLVFDNLTNNIKKEYPQLKRATGSWYINYGINKRVIFFKVEPAPQHSCVYIAVHDEDYPQLTEESRLHVLLKPPGLQPGNWKRQATVKDNSDLRWAYRLIEEIYNLVMRRYY
ncbi:hypothetical protein [Desulfoscipio gibsoniae]|uniref:Uncharacterized protein n=1 Tax=Desulfoscipio gibsoniae DSM 7213 TaxID=767817 RepID=R4KPW2_9FIRM|nr:hypothetical protein [Desulfoscipio gibsoniae]AGL01691.1 hypothetical protein Desgi_2268 [Desulfoscipio gibsoniae DSM 7213]